MGLSSHSGERARSDSPVSGFSQSNPGVLLIQRQFLIAAAIAGMLEDAGYTVVGPFRDFAAAEPAIKNAPPAAAILDHLDQGRVPSPGVAELSGRGVPFLIFTGHRREEVDYELLPGGEYLQIPAVLEEVIAWARRVAPK